MSSEKRVENYLRKRVKALGGHIRKVKWIGRANAPDDRVMLPTIRYGLMRGARVVPPRAFWVECKATDADMNTPHVRAQFREHKRMRDRGEIVHVVASFEDVDRILA
jgi:hypothetical protein